MTKRNKGITTKICLLIGVGLLVVAVVLFGVWQLGINISKSKTQSYVQTIRTLIPTSQGAVLEERRDNTMSTLSIDGIDFVGVIVLRMTSSREEICSSINTS